MKNRRKREKKEEEEKGEMIRPGPASQTFSRPAGPGRAGPGRAGSKKARIETSDMRDGTELCGTGQEFRLKVNISYCI